MSKIAIVLTGALLIFGCEAVDKETKDKLKDGVVDACYTVLEYNPKDSDARIKKYLDSKQSSRTISKEERVMLERCLIRTKRSEKWGTK